jgi:hypothetical protein
MLGAHSVLVGCKGSDSCLAMPMTHLLQTQVVPRLEYSCAWKRLIKNANARQILLAEFLSALTDKSPELKCNLCSSAVKRSADPLEWAKTIPL